MNKKALIPSGGQKRFAFAGLRLGKDSASTWADIVVKDAKGKAVMSAIHFFTLPKNQNLKGTDIQKKLEKIPGGYRLRLKSEHFARSVMLGCRKVRLDFPQNFFHLKPGEEMVMDIRTDAVLGPYDVYWKALNPAPER
jgi:hypothetical protein